MSSPQTGKSFRFVRPCVRAGEAKLGECVSVSVSSTLGMRIRNSPPPSPRMLFSLFWPAGAWVSSDLHDYSEKLKFYLAWVLRHLSGFVGSPCV